MVKSGKRILALVCTVCILIMSFGCSGKGSKEEKFNFKVGIITASQTYNPDENSFAQHLAELYGSNKVVTAIYSDDFLTLPLMVKSVGTQMVEDKGIKIVIFDRAVKGTLEAIKAIKEIRKDIYVVCIASCENTDEISQAADLVLNTDDVALGKDAVAQAKAMGAEIFVNYTYNRHLEYAEVVRQKDEIQNACKAAGIEFELEASVDPAGANGAEGALQFIREDAVRKQKEYAGKKIAYFSTDSIIQPALIETSLEYKTILPVQTNPSPFVGYIDSLGIDMVGHEFDNKYALEQIRAKLKEKGNEGKMATWSVSMPQVLLETAFTYAVRHVKNEWGDSVDSEKLLDILAGVSGDDDVVKGVKFVNNANKTYDDVFMFSGTVYNF